MSENIVKIVNVETGQELEREMNAQELAQKTKDQEAFLARTEAIDAQVLAKAALLDRLGITADEAKLLLS